MNNKGLLERVFKLKENNTTVGKELLAGVTTFMAMAYILAVNPSILSAAGMEPGAVMGATALAACIGCLIMGFLTNYPFALAPGLGLNAYFAYTICGSMGYSYRFALFAVFIEGVIFIILTLTGFRTVLADSIPLSLKRAISAGIGLFIAFIGLQGANIIVNSDSTLVTLVNFHGSIHTTGITAILCLVGFLVICTLAYHRVRGAVLIGMLATWGLGILCQLTGIYAVTPEEGFYSLIPSFSGFSFASLGTNFGACFDLGGIDLKILDVVVVVFALLYMDLFDTMGCLVGLAGHTGHTDKNGNLLNSRGALLSDAIATCTGAVLGTSTTTTFAESAAGIAAGGRTGLTAVTTGILFLVSIVFAPIFTAVPSFATAPALIYVGFLMMSDVLDLNLKDITEGVPAFFCIMIMILSYSVSDGIAAGVLTYTILNAVTGNKKVVNPMLVILSLLFIVKYIVM
ncbi:MAG: NCS2 family permease [Lachnospiraceae bacterium]|nr:NCS2 family permease [Lachnospiraceae bacterium]